MSLVREQRKGQELCLQSGKQLNGQSRTELPGVWWDRQDQMHVRPMSDDQVSVKTLIASLVGISTDEILTPQEAAEILGIQHRSVLKALERGTLNGIKVGDRWYMKRESVYVYRDRDTTSS